MTIAEGIENLQIDYGYDTDGDGVPDSDINAANALFATPDNWRNVVSAKVYLLARSMDKSPGFTDGKAYSMGTMGRRPRRSPRALTSATCSCNRCASPTRA